MADTPQAHPQVYWEGDSKSDLDQFPSDIKRSLGYNLFRVQLGEVPMCDTRSMPSIGKGVWELKESDERSWYRLIYLSKIGNVIYVLHCFEKRSRKTSKQDIETARLRLKRVLLRLQEKKREKGS